MVLPFAAAWDSSLAFANRAPVAFRLDTAVKLTDIKEARGSRKKRRRLAGVVFGGKRPKTGGGGGPLSCTSWEHSRQLRKHRKCMPCTHHHSLCVLPWSVPQRVSPPGFTECLSSVSPTLCFLTVSPTLCWSLSWSLIL